MGWDRAIGKKVGNLRLHTSLSEREVTAALRTVKVLELVTPDVTFKRFRAHRSATHANAFEIQLGTWDKHSLPDGTVDQWGKKMRVRKYKNSGDSGATSGESVWAATYDEWGWFIAMIFRDDPDARFGPYVSRDGFHTMTGHRFAKFMLPPRKDGTWVNTLHP